MAGDVCSVDSPTLAALDRLEGHPRFYRRTPITLAGGRQALAYLQNPGQTRGRPSITSGDWRRPRKENRS